MSVLSTVTGSLPNVLNLIQGEWNVEYRNTIPLSEEEREKAWKEIEAVDKTSAIGMLIAFNDAMALLESGWKELDFDSFIEMNEVDDTQITTNPVEQGSFRSVNKVRKPKTIKVTLAKAGIGYGIEDSLKEVKELLPKARYAAEKQRTSGQMLSDVIDAVSGYLSGQTNVIDISPKIKSIPMEFRITTPFDMIDGLNLIKLDYTFKRDNGRNMLLMYLTFQEILEAGGKTKKQVKNPTNSNAQNTGRKSLQG